MGNHRSLGICQCLQKKPLPGMSVVPDVRGWKGRGDSWGAAPHRCWWKENCGRPAQGDLCGAAHRPCASALLTHSGRRRPPCCPLENTREMFLSHLGWRSLLDRECLLRAVSLLHCHLAATAGRAGDLRLLTGWQIIFEKRICQFSSVFVTERSSLLSAAPRAVHPTARLCSPVLPQVPALGELPWHICPNHTRLELCSYPRSCSSHLFRLQKEFALVPPAAQAPSAVSAPSACSSFPGFSSSSLTLQAASFCWQHPDSFLLAFVSWSSCNQSLLEIHWVWEQLWIPLPKLNQMYIYS